MLADHQRIDKIVKSYLFYYYYKFLLGYIHFTGGGFVVTILIRLMLYIIYIAPIVSPPQPSLHPT
jgi:hypothetical protein